MNKKWIMVDEFYALDETWMMVDEFHPLDELKKNYILNKICYFKN